MALPTWLHDEQDDVRRRLRDALMAAIEKRQQSAFAGLDLSEIEKRVAAGPVFTATEASIRQRAAAPDYRVFWDEVQEQYVSRPVKAAPLPPWAEYADVSDRPPAREPPPPAPDLSPVVDELRAELAVLRVGIATQRARAARYESIARNALLEIQGMTGCPGCGATNREGVSRCRDCPRSAARRLQDALHAAEKHDETCVVLDTKPQDTDAPA